MRFVAALFLAVLLFPAAGSAGPLPGVKQGLSHPVSDQVTPKRPPSIFGPAWGAMTTDPEDQWLIGWRYYTGQDVKQDYAAALKWWLRAANQGDVRAECKIGLMYYTGKGVAQDYAQAYFWLSLVQKYKSGDHIFPAPAWYDASKHLTGEQIAALNLRVKSWKPVPEHRVGH